MNKDSYNQIASIFNEHRKNAKINPYLELFKRSVKRNGDILDLGVGTGYPNTSYLSDQGLFITGIDFSDEMIKIEKSYKISNTTFILSDMLDIKTNTKFDGIIIYDSLFYLEKNKQELMFKKISRLLNVGGILLFTHGLLDSEIKSRCLIILFIIVH